MRFASKRDPHRVQELRRTSLAFVAAGVLSAVAAFWLDALFIVSVMCVGMGVAVAWMLHTTDYEIASDRLRIRCGAARSVILFADIERISPSRETWNAPALSYDRLRIDYRRRSKRCAVLVSPQDAAGFLSDLREAAGLVADDGGLMQAGSAPRVE